MMRWYFITEALKKDIVHELRLRVFPRKELLADLSAQIESLPEIPAVTEEQSWAFECENCGRKHTAMEIVERDSGDCINCGDTVITYTIDAARYIVSLYNLKVENEKLKQEYAELLRAMQDMAAAQVIDKIIAERDTPRTEHA